MRHRKEERIMRVVFMGTPDFAKESLEAVFNSEHEILLVVTNPDRTTEERNETKTISC